MSGEDVRDGGGRALSLWAFLAVVLVYVAIIQVGGRVIGADLDADEGYETAKGLLESALLPIALSCLFAIAVATGLGWWREIVHEPRRTQRWVRVVPFVLLLAAAAGASWGSLLDQKAELVLVFVALVCVAIQRPRRPRSSSCSR